jgi:hypothetical protein
MEIDFDPLLFDEEGLKQAASNTCLASPTVLSRQ